MNYPKLTTTTIQENVAAVLSKCPWMVYHGVEVFPEDLKNLTNTLKAHIAKFGICAIVAIPSVRATSSASRVIVAESAFTVEIYETPLMNRDRANSATCTQAAEYIATALNLTPIDAGDGNTILPVFTDYTPVAISGGGILTTVSFKFQTTLTPIED